VTGVELEEDEGWDPDRVPSRTINTLSNALEMNTVHG
jgi:hypothetical protein